METESIVSPSANDDTCGGGSHVKENGNHYLRRRCWDEAFASASESDSISPEPSLGQELPEENVEEVNMCCSTTCEGNEKATTTSILCEAHPSCFKTFSSVRDYEDHYNLRHRHKCVTCKKSLPSAHILELHVLEAHDTLFSLMAERKPMLACFLETCSTTFWKSDERKEHCLTEHRFPKSFYLWDLAAIGGNKPGKKSGGGSSKGKGANKQNQCKAKDKSSPPNLKGKSTSSLDSFSDDVTSISTNGVSASESNAVPTPNPQNEKMELDAPLVVEHQNKNPKPESSNKNKNSTKFVPTQITFGRHSASRTFKPNYSFGLSKTVKVPAGGAPECMSASKTDLDMSDIKDVLPISTDSAIDCEQT